MGRFERMEAEEGRTFRRRRQENPQEGPANLPPPPPGVHLTRLPCLASSLLRDLALLSLLDVYVGFGGPPVLDHLNLQIEEGERVCLLGRNGAGKSTLMRIAAGENPPDSGTVTQPDGVHIARLTQEIPEDLPGTVRDIVTSGLREDDISEDWEKDIRVDDLIARLGLPEDRAFNDLSGGLKRRCLLAKALAAKPGLLLLDEPTDNLDLASAEALEDGLEGFEGTVVTVTHDRWFARSFDRFLVFGEDGVVRESPEPVWEAW
ncbi:MAG: ABC transporter ATP-binding protein [Verrucomicrobia bacterium]|nr:ABC transporter ATP-binding protein [Verrucomicrobiota bacterium]